MSLDFGIKRRGKLRISQRAGSVEEVQEECNSLIKELLTMTKLLSVQVFSPDIEGKTQAATNKRYNRYIQAVTAIKGYEVNEVNKGIIHKEIHNMNKDIQRFKKKNNMEIE